MQTCCPHCQTTFRVTDEQLSAAAGKVRCGRCFGVFVALDHRTDAPHADEPKLSDGTEAIIDSSIDTDINSDELDRIQIELSAADIELDSNTPSINTQIDEQLLEDIQQRDATPPKKHGVILPLVASLLLCTTLATQYIYHHRNQLGQDPQFHPWLSQACQQVEQLAGELIPCHIKPIRAPQHITLVQREVRLHPEYEQTLLVSARFNNSADFAQAYPMLELTFHDINGITIFARRFHADEYLEQGPNLAGELAAQQSAKVQLELADPGPNAVGFEFNFL